MVFPTAKARAAFDTVKSMAAEVYEEALAGLPPEVRKTLVAGLQTICDNLSDGESACGSTTRETETAG